MKFKFNNSEFDTEEYRPMMPMTLGTQISVRPGDVVESMIPKLGLVKITIGRPGLYDLCTGKLTSMDDMKYPRTKQVFQWAYKNASTDNWIQIRRLLTEVELHEEFAEVQTHKLAGPFEVPL